jgi:hypothetical protein
LPEAKFAVEYKLAVTGKSKAQTDVSAVGKAAID